ncbi:MAG TPA: sodium:solute symporter [Candidatus Nitrosotalea sp.]|nr:sodium:solute symporter [Candidatus Nitrosotalea sp.]
MNAVSLTIFIVLFVGIAIIGLFAGRWRPPAAGLTSLEEWGLGGRRFGTLVTWFLIGGDIYTAYTFIAVPALVFGKGALGLFALPYTVIVYPFIYVVIPKLWRISKANGYVTASDFVRHRFDSRALALMVAVTGIGATMPYIALQIFGIQVVLSQMGVPVEASLVIAFLVLAVFTYVSGLRAPALIAVVKDALIWITVIVMIVYIPIHLGGYGAIFAHVPPAKLILSPQLYGAYASLALGSALALFLYPHALTGVFGAKSERVVKRNAALLPAYSFLLGLIAILGYMAIAAGVHASKTYGANSAVPALVAQLFPSWFVGFAFAAIAIGALVPASVMSIAAANLFSRNIYRDLIRPSADQAEEANVSKIASLVVKVGALLFILVVPTTFIINFQLAGGVWILQTLPAVILAMYAGWLRRGAVIAGWAVGMAWGTLMLVQEGFASSVQAFNFLGLKSILYIALVALVANLVVVVVWSVVARVLAGVPKGYGMIESQSPAVVEA